MRRNVNLESIRQYPKLLDQLNRSNLNSKSELYLLGNVVYKIFDENVREDSEIIVLESAKYPLGGLVPMIDSLYEQSSFLGYTMPLIQEPILKSLIGKLSFQRKFWILKRISSIFGNLYSNGFLYQDLDISNIVVGKSGILFLDREGMISLNDLQDGRISFVINSFFDILLSLLYDEDFSLNPKGIDTTGILGIKDMFYDIRFFELNNIFTMLDSLEKKGKEFYNESKGMVRSLIL